MSDSRATVFAASRMFTNGMGKIRVIVRRPSSEPATVAITTSLLAFASATALMHSARCRWNRNTPFFSSVVWCTCSSSQLQYRKNAFTSFSAGSLFFSRVRLEMNEIWGATTASAALTSSAVRESLRSLSRVKKKAQAASQAVLLLSFGQFRNSAMVFKLEVKPEGGAYPSDLKKNVQKASSYESYLDWLRQNRLNTISRSAVMAATAHFSDS